MTDLVADRLRELILSGELATGERITQGWLAKQLGVSTMPVREALLRLVTEGLVIAEPNRSFTIARNTEDDLRDVFWLHATIAGELSRRAAAGSTPELVEALTQSHRQYVDNIDDLDKRFAANWAFFRAVNLAADSPRLLLMLQLTLRYFPNILTDVDGSAELAERWQRDLLKAITKGDTVKAEAISQKYARQAGELYVSSRR